MTDSFTLSCKPIRINDEFTYTPPAPTAESEIFFSDLPKKDQCWPNAGTEALHQALDLPKLYWDWNENTLINQEHTIYDDEGTLTHLDYDDTRLLLKIRDRELRRRQNGVYFYNDGQLEYLTGNNYFFLSYYIIPDAGHPEFREFQRDVFYLLQIAIDSPVILGVFIIKAKKTGLSHLITSVLLNESTMIRNRAFGVMNKTQPEANDVNMNFFWSAYNELPDIMRPQWSAKNLSKVIFGAPLVKFTGTKQSIQKAVDAKRNKPLNTWVYSAATKLNPKFDGPLMYRIHLDEFPKWTVSPAKIYGKVTETVKLQETIVGKIFITSYPPEEDGPGFEEAKRIYFNSKLSTIKGNVLGRTQSGLICHCVSALVSTNGTFDKYGRADEVEALRLNQAGRDLTTSTTELQEKIRQYGRNEEEMWRSGGSGSTFDNGHLAEAVEEIDILERSGETLYTEGVLEWENGLGSKVLYTPFTDKDIKAGRKPLVRMYERYPVTQLNNIQVDSDGFFHPLADTKFVAASDPTEYKIKSDVRRDPSDWAVTVMSFADTQRNTLMGRTASKVIVAEYLYRHDDPDVDFDNMVKMCFYFGCYILIEANKQWAVTKMRKMNLHRFLLLRQQDGSILPYEEGEQNRAVSSTKDVIDEYCRLISSYIRRPTSSDEIDYCKLLRNRKLVLNLMRFNPLRTKEFDNAVCFGLCLMAMASFSVLRERLLEMERKDRYIEAAFTAIVDYV